jgi:gluconate 2-dehydrogenase gamma chain
MKRVLTRAGRSKIRLGLLLGSSSSEDRRTLHAFQSTRLDLRHIGVDSLGGGNRGPGTRAEGAPVRRICRFKFFDRATAEEVSANAAQILPSTDGPGATEAGVIFFIDHALKTFDADKAQIYRGGMAELQRVREKMFPASASMAELSGEQQIELVRAIEKSEFFELVRTQTLLGFLGNPSYGGNRNEVGWKYIGFEDRMTWEPPFGYYDAETT